MNILHISTALPPDGKGGQEKCVMKIIDHFQKKLNLDVVIRESNLVKKNFPLHRFDQKLSFKNIIKLSKTLIPLMKKTDLIHYHYPVSFFPYIPMCPVFLFLNFFFKKKYIVHIHIMTSFEHYIWKFPTLRFIFRKMLIIFFKKSSFIMTPTNLTKKNINLNYGISIKKIKTIPYGVSDIFFTLNLNKLVKNFKKIIYVGRLSIPKRVDYLIKAFMDLPESYHLDIYGDGEEYENLIILANGCKRIKFHGYILSEEKIAEAYEGADLFVLPSINEEMPLSILEALAAGVPVLCSDLASIKSRYKNLIFYFKDISILSKKIIELTNQNNELKIKQGKRFALKYKWERNFEKINNSYMKVMKN
ncbi:MAG: glycosyltransferase family 4 protein [Promethearchaeota archaeon]